MKNAPENGGATSLPPISGERMMAGFFESRDARIIFCRKNLGQMLVKTPYR
jgi:hypothetical protein